MADEQKTEQEQQPVENKVEEVIEEKEPMVSQSEVDKIVERIIDLKKTWYLKTAIIEKECINNLNKDIFEGPKYLVPLIESISLN